MYAMEHSNYMSTTSSTLDEDTKKKQQHMKNSIRAYIQVNKNKGTKQSEFEWVREWFTLDLFQSAWIDLNLYLKIFVHLPWERLSKKKKKEWERTRDRDERGSSLYWQLAKGRPFVLVRTFRWLILYVYVLHYIGASTIFFL